MLTNQLKEPVQQHSASRLVARIALRLAAKVERATQEKEIYQIYLFENNNNSKQTKQNKTNNNNNVRARKEIFEEEKASAAFTGADER